MLNGHFKNVNPFLHFFVTAIFVTIFFIITQNIEHNVMEHISIGKLYPYKASMQQIYIIKHKYYHSHEKRERKDVPA